MAHMQYLVFNNENISKPVSYSVSLLDVEADSGGVTEAGTTQRDVVREGVVQIGVTFRVSKKWLNEMWVHSPPLGAQANFNRIEKHDTM